MHHFFVEPSGIVDGMVTITGPDVNHMRNVLRVRDGDEFYAGTGTDGLLYRCRIEQTGTDSVKARILWAEHEKAELPCEITLYQGLPKSDKMEMIIQKAVELGVHEIVPVAMKRSVVKLSGGKAEARIKRWNAISESAAKQSRRMYIPPVGPVLTTPQAAKKAAGSDVILLPYELAGGMGHTSEVLHSIPPGQSVALFIGPEGGFEPEEVRMLEEAGAMPITLGRRILRTETAGMAVLSMLMMLLEEES